MRLLTIKKKKRYEKHSKFADIGTIDFVVLIHLRGTQAQYLKSSLGEILTTFLENIDIIYRFENT